MPGVYLSEKEIDLTPRIQKNIPTPIPPPPPPPNPPFSGNNGSFDGWVNSQSMSISGPLATLTITE